MRTVHATRARKRWSLLLSRVFHAGERIVICRNGQEIAAIVPHADVHLLEELADEADIEAARAAIAAEKGAAPTPWKEIKRYTELER